MTKALDIKREHRGELARINAPPAIQHSSDRLDLAALWTMLRRRMVLFLSVAALVLLAAIVLTARQTPLYTARAQLVMDERQERIAPRSDQEQAPGDPDRTDTEVQVLLSRELAAHVVDALGLVRNPDFNPALKVETSRWSGMLQRIGLAAAPAPRPLPSAEETRRHVTDRVLDGLKVTRQAETRAVEISFTAPTRDEAALIANEYARQYTGAQLQQKLQENKEATQFLAGRLERLRAQAQADTLKVQQYRIANNLLSTSGASLTEQEISSYNQAVANARAQAAEDQARLGTAQSQLRHGSAGDDVGEALNSPVVTGFRERQAALSEQLADLETRYGDNHPDVIKARNQVADIDRQIQAEIARVISNLQAKRQVSEDRLGSLSGSLSHARGSLQQNNRAMAKLDDLVRGAQASQELYESYLNRYKETVAAGGTERPDAKVISWAEVPLVPSSPKWGLSLFLGVVIGLAAGFAAAFVAEMTFSGLTTGEDVEQRLSLPYLAGIPSLRSVGRTRDTPEQAATETRTAFSESFQALRTSLHYANPPRPQVVAITSALPKEGKSTIAACLARVLANDGRRTLLIDCDVVRGQVSRRLCGTQRSHGLLELLNGEASLEEAVAHDSRSPLHVLPLSSKGRRADNFADKRLLELIEALRGRYDHIIIDTAPVLPITATRLICAMADATVIVARWRHTPDHAVRAALRLLPAQYVNVVGVVLSRINAKRQSRYGRGDAGFYFNKYREYYA